MTNMTVNVGDTINRNGKFSKVIEIQAQYFGGNYAGLCYLTEAGDWIEQCEITSNDVWKPIGSVTSITVESR